MNKNNLHKYQRKMVNWVIEKERCALYADMGLGKTISTLTAINELFNVCEISKVLVIAPLKVILNTWAKEIEQWDHTKWMRYTLLLGTPIERRLKLYEKTQIHLINRELVPWLYETFKLLSIMPYDMIIVDESSSFKANGAKRTKALKKISPTVNRFVELTATPASNGLIDLWPQIYMLDFGERLGKTLSEYQAKYFDSDFMGYKLTLKKEAKDIIYSKLEDLCLRLSSEDYLELPDKMEHKVELDFPPKLWEGYKMLEKDFLLELSKDENIVAFNSGAKVNKLLQYCNGAVYIDENNYASIHDLKLDALEEIIEESQGEPILIAYSFRHDKERILKRFPGAVVLDRKGTQMEAWNKGQISLMLAHPASAGHGINLQHGGNIIVWYGQNWSLELVTQLNGRIHRQGQTKPVQIYYILMRDTVDNIVFQAIQDKDVTQKELLNRLKLKVIEDLK